MTPIDPRLILSLIALHRHRTTTLAGQTLGLTQPAVSHALRRLREHYGDPLFVRRGNQFAPTPFCDALVAEAAAAVAALEALARRRARFLAAEATDTFRLLLNDVGQATMLPAIMAALGRAAPGCSVEVRRLEYDGVGAALSEGALDLAIGNIPSLGPATRRQLLFEGRYVLLSAARPRGGPDRYIVVRYGNTAQERVERQIDRALPGRRAALQLPNFLPIPEIVAAGDLVAVVPQPLAALYAADPRLRVRPAPAALKPFGVYQYWHARFDRDPANAWLRGLVAGIFQGRPFPLPPSDAGKQAA